MVSYRRSGGRTGGATVHDELEMMMARKLAALAIENEGLKAVVRSIAAMSASAAGADSFDESVPDLAREARVLADHVLGG